MKEVVKRIIEVVFILFLIGLIFSFFSVKKFEIKPEIEKVGINVIAQKINEGQVKKIIVSGNEIKAILKNKKILLSSKEPEAGFTETLKNLGVLPEKLREIEIEIKEASQLALWLGFIIPSILPILLLILFFWWSFKQAQKGAGQAFTFVKSRLKKFRPEKDRITFDDVADLKEAKEELQEIVDFLKNPQKFLDIGAKIPRGVLLVGPAGVGKTLLARAVAGTAGVPFFYISGSEFVELFVGVGASRVRDAFQTAKEAARKEGAAILFIDEIDAIGRERGAGLGGGHDEREQTLNQILVEMDGFEKEDRLIVMAASNRPDILDPALLRPGRFDRRIVLDLPDLKGREEILKIHSRHIPLAKDVDLKVIAERTPGFSGADLENLVNEAAILAARKDKKVVGQEEFLAAIEKVLLGPERKSFLLSEKERKIAAYHEAGHAIVSAFTPSSSKVQKISIVARGKAAGYTLRLPEEEKHFKTKSEFLADLASLLGGYAAEKLVFGEITTGAANDLRDATDIARALVTKYGMSSLGPIAFGKFSQPVFLGREIAVEKDYSDEVAAKIDRETKKFIDQAYKTAMKILKKHRKFLDKVAQILMKKETIEKEEFEKLVEEEKKKIKKE